MAVTKPEAAAGLAAAFADCCVCPRCLSLLRTYGMSALRCISCGTRFEIRDGVALLLPEYEDETRQRYASVYERVAHDDLEQPFEEGREIRHSTLLGFIGDVRAKRVLDIGSSNGGYLAALDAGQKVGLDVALPFLEAIPDGSGILRVCADAENLPVRAGHFDVIVVSDVLEHLLEPERLMERLLRVCRPDTRLIVHVPWKESIAKYDDSPYEFTHLRSFNDYTFAHLWRYFEIRREQGAHPSLEEPVIFQLRRFLPLPVYNRLVRAYFHGNLGAREYRWRARWIEELPKHERWLLRLYPPVFKMFELRLPAEHAEVGHRPRSTLRSRLRLGL